MSSIFDELLDTDVLAEVDDGADITGDSMFQYYQILECLHDAILLTLSA